MRQYKSIPIARLVSDVAVDPVHVRELADSIKVCGPISPVLVREDNFALIDGFHRVAAMKELGFQEIECILTTCDDETFWDLRIISASLHKAVTFARVIDWIEEVFQLSPWKDEHKSAYSLFATVNKRGGTKEAVEWVNLKAQKWGLAPATVQNWLYAKQSLAPDLLQEAKYSVRNDEGMSLQHYQSVARTIPGRPELQRQVIEKARAEGLTSTELEQVARAVRQVKDSEEVRSILNQPVTRSAEQMVREAKVERLLSEPAVLPAPREQQRKLAGIALEVYLDLQQQVHNVRRLSPSVVQTLAPDQKNELLRVVNELMGALRQLADSLGGSVKGAIVIEGKMLKGGSHGASDQRVQR